MTELLALSRDFIDRMTDPAHGLSVNEDYAVQFGAMLAVDGFRTRFNDELKQVRNLDTFTNRGWLWAVDWANSHDVELPEDILFELLNRWSSAVAKVEILDFVTRSDGDRAGTAPLLPIDDFPHPFLRRVLTHETAEPDDRIVRRTARRQSTESTLLALLQIDRFVTLNAAAALLRHKWSGQDDLVEFFWSLAETLENGTREVWIARLRPPDRRQRQTRTRS